VEDFLALDHFKKSFYAASMEVALEERAAFFSIKEAD